MATTQYAISKSNNLTRCKLLKAKRLGRGPGSNYGKLSGRGMNGQKSKEAVPISQSTKQWRLSHPKVFIMKKRATLRNPRFVITNNMLNKKELQQVVLSETLKMLSENILSNTQLRHKWFLAAFQKLINHFKRLFCTHKFSQDLSTYLNKIEVLKIVQDSFFKSVDNNVKNISENTIDNIVTDLLTNKKLAQYLSFQTVKKIVSHMLNNITLTQDILSDISAINIETIKNQLLLPKDLSFTIIAAIFDVSFQYKQIRILQNNNKTIVLNNYNT